MNWSIPPFRGQMKSVFQIRRGFLNGRVKASWLLLSIQPEHKRSLLREDVPLYPFSSLETFSYQFMSFIALASS